MKRLLAAALALAVLIGPFAPTLRAGITPDQVRKAIDKGVRYLKQQQQKGNGSWADWGSFPGGVTALCTLALLNSGLGPDDPEVERALNWLRKQEPQTTYVVALQTMVFAKAADPTDRLLISRNVKWLEETQIKQGDNKGAWAYPRASGDNSNSQFALLGLYEAERAGVKVDPHTWGMAYQYWDNAQKLDGSWGYTSGSGSMNRSTGSMTCAGIASLVITSGKVGRSAARATPEGRIECCGGGEKNDDVERGLDWLGRNFSVTGNPGTRGGTWLLYYLYGVERVGRLTAHRFIGGHDWYREGAEWLVAKQDSISGFWKGIGHGEDDPLIATSFALLFLSKGRWPVLVGKLKYTDTSDWNEHPHDVHNLTRYVEPRWKMDLTWQVIDQRAATVEDLLQAPVLYFCGRDSPLPAAADARERLARQLRDYLDRGGFIFAESYRDGAAFDQGFRELMERVFPEPEYQLRDLPAEHPIWRAEELPKQVRPLEGIEFGCRTSVVYARPDGARPSMSCLWELSESGRGVAFVPSVQEQIDSALAIGVNVLAYATNRELESKEIHFRDRPEDRPRDPISRGRVMVAKIRHPGGCNAAPRALVNLMDRAAEQLHMRTGTSDTLVRLTDGELFDYHLIFMDGRNNFRLTDEEKRSLKIYIERGGMLLADAICASPAFIESFRRAMAAIFPDHPLEPIPVDDPMLTTAYGGYDLRTVKRRDPQARTGAGPLKATVRTVPPELEGIKIDDRWAVIFSRYDISCALEKHDSLECRGYVRDDAERIGLNVILYSLQQ